MNLKAVSSTVSWKDVAGFFGIVGLITLGFVIRFDEFKNRLRRSGDLQFVLGFLGFLYCVVLIIGIVIIIKAAGG